MALLSAVIVGREITISALREWMAQMGAHGLVKVAGPGQAQDHRADGARSAACSSGRACCGLPVFLIGEWLLAIAAALTLWSGADYLHGGLADHAEEGLKSRKSQAQC